jgi:GntR family transcriptional regulator/MocR family aminotransferase
VGRSKTPPAKGSIAGADFLQLHIGDAPSGGKSAWLAERLRLAIADGRLSVGTRLPATRALSADLGVSRGVVTEAYQRLIEDGQAAGRGRGGTVILAAPVMAAATATAAPIRSRSAGAPTSSVTATATAPEALFTTAPQADIFDVLRATAAKIDFTPGVPDLSAFPRTAWLSAERAVLQQMSATDFGYGDPRGAPQFRSAISDWLARFRAIRVHPDEVIVVAGVAQAIALLAQALGDDGIGQIAVEDPGSLGARQHLQSHGLRTPPVPVDDAGLAVDALRASGAGAVMLTPAHQFPTGVVLDGGRRRELMAWIDSGGLVIEDDYDAEHRYGRPPVPALRSLHAQGVIYMGSVSKTLSPALRVGWLLTPHRYREQIVAAKRFADLGNPVLAQLVLAQMMRSGAMERHLRMLRRRHQKRRDAMVQALHQHLPGARIHGVAAGLHLTVTFDSDIADTELAAQALTRGVKVQPLTWHRQRPGPPGLVMGYAAVTVSQGAQGIEIIGQLLRSAH